MILFKVEYIQSQEQGNVLKNMDFYHLQENIKSRSSIKD